MRVVEVTRFGGPEVLVTAAGGGVGIQLDLILELGADAAVDYSRPDWTERVRKATGGAGPDVVFDGAGGQIGLAAFEATARGGRFSAHGAASGGFAAIDPQEAERRGVTVRGIE